MGKKKNPPSAKVAKETFPLDNFMKLIFKKFKLTERQKEFLSIAFDPNTKIVFFNGPAGTGKAQPLDSIIYTPEGPKTMGDIQRGDYVLSEDGKPIKVLDVFPQGIKKVFKVSFSDGSSTECCEDHLWLTQTHLERNNRSRKKGMRKENIRYKNPKDPQVRDTIKISNSLTVANGSELNHSIPITKPVEFEKKELPINPYILGCLIGDGGLTTSVTISNIDQEIIDYFKRNLNDYNFRFDGKNTYQISYPHADENPLKRKIKQLELNTKSENKFIPDIYKYSSIEDRLSILQGLMDTDGTASKKGSISFSSCSERLANDLIEIVQSLGGICKKRKYKSGYFSKKYGKHIECQDTFIVTICLPNDIMPFKLKRKIEAVKPRSKYFPIRYITNVEYLEDKECKCILVDNKSHLYLTDNYIVTHNTFLAVYAALKIFNQDQDKEIVYVRTIAESGEKSLGSLPGGVDEKISPFGMPLFDKLEEILNRQQAKELIEKDIIKFISINHTRGANWANKVIVADEAQNFNFKELITLLTRIAEETKYFLCGDLMQSDINGKSGLKKVIDTFDTKEAQENGIHVLNFTKDDIMRSEILKFIVNELEKNI